MLPFFVILQICVSLPVNFVKFFFVMENIVDFKNTEESHIVPSGFPELDEWVEVINKARPITFGYPANNNMDMSDFYEWFFANGLSKASLNNAGDPFSGNKGYALSSSKFEREVIEWFAPYYGFNAKKVWGIVTMSGTDGNNHGIFFGVKYLRKKTGKNPVLYVSDEAHYSNYRLADLQNLEARVVKSDIYGCMIPEELEKVLDPTRPCLIIYAMGSTFKGSIDNQKALNAVLAKYPEMEVYRHVDAALFGGYLPFSEFADKISHQELGYQSIAISSHKFFSIDSPSGLFICEREIYDAQTDFNVLYLNNNMRMINCSRSAIEPLKFWWLIKKKGYAGWRAEAMQISAMTFYLIFCLKKIDWPFWYNECSNTVLFKRPSAYVMDKYSLSAGYDERLGGELAHIVVMQHVLRKGIDQFIEDLVKEK